MTAAGHLLQRIQRHLPSCSGYGLVNVESGRVELRYFESGPDFLDSALPKVMVERFAADEDSTQAFLYAAQGGVGRPEPVAEVMIGTDDYLALGLRLVVSMPLALILILDPRTNLGVAWALARAFRAEVEMALQASQKPSPPLDIAP